MRDCDHDQHVPHFVEADEPSYYSPPWCHVSPDNWFNWSDQSQLHRGSCGTVPAWGLLGTPGGLVPMRGQLDATSTIGPSMAVALLTTFYGAVLSNMVFSPLAAKLERNSDEEMLLNNIYVTGVTSIGRQENPRRLEMLVNTLLSPADRVQHFD